VNTFETGTLRRNQRTGAKSLTGTRLPFVTPAARTGDTASTLRQTFTVTHAEGLHARPCSLLIRAVQPFDCTVTVRHGDHVANGRSILGLLSLGAGCDSKVTFCICGPEAQPAMASVKKLFEAAFGTRREVMNPSE